MFDIYTKISSDGRKIEAIAVNMFDGSRKKMSKKVYSHLIDDKAVHTQIANELNDRLTWQEILIESKNVANDSEYMHREWKECQKYCLTAYEKRDNIGFKFQVTLKV